MTPIEVPLPLVEFILLGPTDDRRQLQESPILGDVWIEYARQPDQAVDLLITPVMTCSAGSVAVAIQDRFDKFVQNDQLDPQISYLQGTVAARLAFRHLLLIVVPMTRWFTDKWIEGKNSLEHQFEAYGKVVGGETRAQHVAKVLLEAAKAHFGKGQDTANLLSLRLLTPSDRYAVLAGLILWAGRNAVGSDGGRAATATERTFDVLSLVNPEDVAKELMGLVNTIALDKRILNPSVFQISRNRAAKLSLDKSVAAVKGDAAANLFQVDCAAIGWAVLDSGIDATHPAFSNLVKDRPRVRKCFDFTKYRRIVNLSNAKDHFRAKNLEIFLKDRSDLVSFNETKGSDRRNFAKARDKDLRHLADDARRGGAIEWELVEKFIEISPKTPPLTNHGTHVAGIIGASKKAVTDSKIIRNDCADGMCPNITLYDFRVVGPTLQDTEFAVIAALQYIRYINDRDSYLAIHGANLSLSIPHDVRNYACGSTPVCIESERLVESGVVVVAAAGNHGYKSFETKDGSFESYAAFSITDPGNAEGVITVGSTHRHWPHTYGVSFFSSRGPTGDGRLKPDLVAPGERIRAPFPGGEWGDLDGTSMAAPHVSGAAAMLMARYSELIGHPQRVKKILCDNATDLGRERSFQGHGMLDVLRAFQSI